MTWHMTKNLIAAALLLAATGCSTLSEYTPSLKYCEKVSYERIGAKMKINAECTVPVGAGAL